ncbi:shikimate transporter [Escherichia sp. E2593]|uniref:prophage tail fiber N-terminal domain-containing protein n=1 Tax=unclassified Escherichia TaxID=2608889 RepID=UPI00102A408E|nr:MULTISPECIES: prophage tail fiber N-terminal domain-containing protein [unclassified Escherichia]RZN38897.1 shikimate transporter [Escherichia sp. E10V5]TGC08259.1 shikimate transporter [Escherichia sp. E2593]TLI78846.1 shikimate transporter [Escherichia sp. E2593]
MSVVISGALIDGAGIPMSGCHIILKSCVNTSEVVMRTVADVVTGAGGEYSFEAQTGKYCVYLKQDWCDEHCVGDIAVYDDSKPGTLNDFLTALDEDDLKPDVVKRFEEMVAQAQQSAEAAAESERLAEQHVTDAQKIKHDCQALADNVQQNAEAVAEDKKQVALLASSASQDAARAEQAVKDADKIVDKAVDKLGEAATLTGEAKASAEAAAKSEQNAKSHADNAAGSAQQTAQDVTATKTARDDAELFAGNARQDAVATAEDRKATAEDVKSTGANAAAAGQSAQDAAGYARAAEQAKNDIDVTLSGTLKTVNHLSEIAAAGEDAQQESRDNLGLTVAATMPPQNDTYDRAEGCLAIPGAFGFGKIFSSSDRTEFKSGTDFLRWVKTAKPGRYTVFADTNVVVPGIQTNGVIEIIWPQPKSSTDDRAYKTVIYYGVNGQIYCNRYVGGQGYLTGWENLKVDVASLIAQIEARAPLKSPALTGTPSTPTPPDDAAGNEIANAEFVRKLLAALVDSSPEALDTLNELAAALGNDPNFATTVTNALAGKQPLNDMLTAVSQITPEENTLPYFSEEGRILLAQLSEKARALLALDTPEAMRTELELKAAATMEPQSDIRDRTPGRLALSGIHGFGQAFASADALAFEGLSDFVEWLKKVTPGRYAVSITDSSQLLTGTTQFNGIIDVMWSPYANSESDTVRKFKTLMCYNQYYQGEHCIHYMQYRYNDSDNSWNMSSRVVVYDGDSLAYLLSRMAGSGSYYKYPAVGSLLLAVYQGTAAGDKAIKIGQGDIVPGSRLGPVNITCSINDAGSYVSTPRVSAGGAGAFSFPGRYQALSGFSNSYGDEGRICLFVRIE